MRLTIVGCSGSVPGPDSPGSCYLVEADGFALALDLGSGAFGVLQRHVAIDRLGAVLLSHLHSDHCTDLSALPVALKHGPYGRTDRVPILGPAGLFERVVGISGFTTEDDIRELNDMFDFRPVTESFPIGPLRVTARRVDHPVEAYAYRIEHGGRAFAYSGDCAPCPGVEEVTQGADLALVEAAFVEDEENPPGVHHTARESGELAERCGVGRLVTTHVPPWFDPIAQADVARRACSCAVDAARSGDTYEV